MALKPQGSGRSAGNRRHSNLQQEPGSGSGSTGDNRKGQELGYYPNGPFVAVMAVLGRQLDYIWK